MRADIVQIREYSRPKREKDYGLENALAKYVRNRWPEKTIQYVAREFDLSERLASSVVYANPSRTTLRGLLHHKRGGFGLFLELLCEATGTRLEAFIEKQAEEARREAAEHAARERTLEAMAARLAESRSFRRTANQ
jgi:hypothetical protein